MYLIPQPMNVWEFLQWGITTYPSTANVILMSAIGLITVFGFMICSALLLHGFTLAYTAAPDIPDNTCHLTGTITEDAKIRKERRKDFNMWFERNKGHIAVWTFLLIVAYLSASILGVI